MCLYQNNPSCDVQALSSLNNCLDFTTFQQSESVQRNFYFVELYNHCAFFSLWDFKTFQKCQRLVSILGHSTVWLGVPIPSFKVCQLVVGQKVMSCTRRSSCVHSYPHTLYRPCTLNVTTNRCKTISSHVLQKNHSSCLLWPYCALFSLVTPLAFPLIQSSINGNSISLPTKGVNFFSPLLCVWREGPIISAVWEFKRHACSNLLFHSPGPLSSRSSFPVSYSSYPSTGKPPPAAASDPELSSWPLESDNPFP